VLTDAQVTVPELGLSTSPGSHGGFEFRDVTLPDPTLRTDLFVDSPGYGTWALIHVLLVADDSLILDVGMTVEDHQIEIPEISLEERSLAFQRQGLSPYSSAGLDQTSLPLPETIRVRVTGKYSRCDKTLPYTVEIVDFKQYVKNVLPNEWIVTWPRESLRAGAMGAKMYAWQIIADGGRYDDADVYDNVCDQVYIPGVSYGSTNRAIDFTWNWRLTHPDGSLFRTHYLDWYWRCAEYGWQGYCMGQWDTKYHAEGNNGYEKLEWDEMLFKYYWNSELSYILSLPPAQFALRFFGNAWGDIDRIKVLIDDEETGGLPVDIGAIDSTLEWWMKARSANNESPACAAVKDSWMLGNNLFDRDISGDGDHGEFGVSLMDGKIAFGVNQGSDGTTICGSIDVADNQWHHIALTRNVGDGQMMIFVDGQLDSEGIGPAGDISYRDGRANQDPQQDPFLVIGARKADLGPAYMGLLDEIRVSSVRRYVAPFSRPTSPFAVDEDTVALYHFDEGHGNRIGDSSENPDGPSDGYRLYGGDPENGPEWELSSLFLFYQFYIPYVQ
jgi:hypothetical protein